MRHQHQSHLWAQEYDRELRDLLILQGEIAYKLLGQNACVQANAPQHDLVLIATKPIANGSRVVASKLGK